ncbi:DUF6933 domain-containing protein [Catellatospora aurea]|uniref:DUF6933 domain-containing protein n=1 Tax=Catellatospora aurea TaxID=1337874 RepID=A0ABW2H4W1_9ACTN
MLGDLQVGGPLLAVRFTELEENGWVLIVRATAKLLKLVGRPSAGDGERGSTLLGQWYATALFWRPRVVPLVNESTLLPVLMPLAPAATLPVRVADEVATVLRAHRAPQAFVDAEVGRMRDCRLGVTVNRSVVGVMVEFARLAEIYRAEPHPDLLGLALRLATTPCSPLYGRNISPDRELAAVLSAATA